VTCDRVAPATALPLVLASASPRRAELLAAAGIAIEVRPADVDEAVLPDESAADYVCRVAVDKARAVGTLAPRRAVLAADTTVVVDGLILGKPGTDEDAARMLRLLSGRTHEVLTGVCVRSAEGRELVRVASTTVEFAPLTEVAIRWYVQSGEPRDKAGAYAIQGRASRFIPRIEGSYSNVVGLPVALVCEMCGEAGILIS
jgi:septum formation protein